MLAEPVATFEASTPAGLDFTPAAREEIARASEPKNPAAWRTPYARTSRQRRQARPAGDATTHSHHEGEVATLRGADAESAELLLDEEW